jgi:hypothetical protein
VAHWDAASKGLRLPERARKKKQAAISFRSFLIELQKIAGT